MKNSTALDPIAFIGLGRMGAPMARRLLAAGHALRVHDRSADARAAFRRTPRVTVCASAAEAATGARVVITMLPDGRAVRAALAGRSGALQRLGRGAVVIDMSSADPADTRALGEACAAGGVRLLDAPVSGRVEGARDGTLTIMVGGPKPTLARVRAVLECMGTQIHHAGPLGAGHIAKALNNYIAAAGTIAAFEATIAGRALGLDPGVLVDIWNASAGRNSTTQNKIRQHVLAGAYASGFALGLMAKDVRIAARIARELGSAAPSLAVNARLWTAATRVLGEGADHTRIYRYLESLGTAPRRR